MSYWIVFTGGAELTLELSVETQFLQDFQAYLENHTQPLTPYLTGKGNVIISFPSIAYVTIGDTVAEVVEDHRPSAKARQSNKRTWKIRVKKLQFSFSSGLSLAGNIRFVKCLRVSAECVRDALATAGERDCSPTAVSPILLQRLPVQKRPFATLLPALVFLRA